MTLEQMEAIALDLQGRVKALERDSGDSIGVPNNFYIGTGGEVKEVGEAGQTGIAILENTREPAAGDYNKPGTLEFELLRAEGIITDSIGALPTEGEIALPGATWLDIPTPFVSQGNGKFKGGLSTQNKGQKLPEKGLHSATRFDLVQLKGTPGTRWKVHGNAIPEWEPGSGHKRLQLVSYNSEGAVIESTAAHEGETVEAFAFPESGIIYVLIISEEAVEPIGAYPYELTFSEVNSNPFEFGQFKLPEDFLYIVSAEFEFLTKEALAFSALMRAQITAELEPPEENLQFSNGSLLTASAAAAKVWDLPSDAAVSLWIPTKQTRVALGGVRILKPASAPGNETEYAWSKQKLVIQQLQL
jgi:hypothetical protein